MSVILQVERPPKVTQTPSSFPKSPALNSEVKSSPFQIQTYPTSKMPDKTPMSQSDASRIQSSQAKGGGDMSSGGFAARAQSAAASNTNSGAGQNTASQANTGGGAGKK